MCKAPAHGCAEESRAVSCGAAAGQAGALGVPAQRGWGGWGWEGSGWGRTWALPAVLPAAIIENPEWGWAGCSH